MAWGDGGNFNDPNNRSQSLGTMLGKVIRIDVDSAPAAGRAYVTPADNPFVSTAGALGEVWAYGLRNPWRCSFHSGGVDKGLLCGDVGQDLVEELNVVRRGQNYGWRWYEGRERSSPYAAEQPPADVTWAAIEYTHTFTGGGAAVIGGHFYSQAGANTCLRGRYLWADHIGLLFVSSEQASGDYSFARLRPICAKESPACNPDFGNIFSFAQDSRGDSYVLGSAGIYRVLPQSRCSLQCGSTEANPAGGGQVNIYNTGTGSVYQTGYWTTGPGQPPLTTAPSDGGNGTAPPTQSTTSGGSATGSSTTTSTTGGTTAATTGGSTTGGVATSTTTGSTTGAGAGAPPPGVGSPAPSLHTSLLLSSIVLLVSVCLWLS